MFTLCNLPRNVVPCDKSWMKNRIREFREGAGLTVDGLAEIAGCSKATISLIENGKRTPSMAMLEAIASALHVPTKILLDDGLIPDPVASEIAAHLKELLQLGEKDRAAIFSLARSLPKVREDETTQASDRRKKES